MRKQGFTLVEIVVVVGLFAMLGGLTLYMSMRTYTSSSLRDEKYAVVTGLEKSRSDAMNSLCTESNCSGGLPHGVHVGGNGIILFQGSAYTANDVTNTVIALDNPHITVGGADIIFQQLSGNVLATSTITLVNTRGDRASVTVGTLGQIAWSN